jgi:DNA-binding transcriptional ArsR family regulator
MSWVKIRQMSNLSANESNVDLLRFFKALADETRLKMVALLASKSRSGEQLAELLSIKRATVSHHLSKLADAGLVSSTSEGHKKFYTLRLDAVRATAQQLQAKGAGLRVPEGADTSKFYPNRVLYDEYDRKVLKRRLAAAASDVAEEVFGRAQAHRQGHRTRPRVHRETDQRSAGAPPPRHGQPAQRHDRLPLDGAQVGRVLACVSAEIRAGSDNSGRLLRITRIAQRSL